MKTPHGLPPLTILGQDAPAPAPAKVDRYGSFGYFAVAGLVILIAWVGWFGVRVWQMRDIWGRIAVLHDRDRPDLERIQAALELARDPRVGQRQLWDMAVRGELPGPARALLAEGLTDAAVLDDPRAYALAVAYSEGWPDWFRIQLLRPMVVAADQTRAMPDEALDALASHDDPAIAALARSIRHGTTPDDPSLAPLLVPPKGDDRRARRDALAAWIRAHHPPTVELWRGLREVDGRVVADPGPDRR